MNSACQEDNVTENDDRRERTLPVTAEVGSEGGSFADPTMQVATFSEDSDIPRGPGHGGPSSVATQATRFDTAAGNALSEAPDAAAGVVRYPTDAPSSPASEGAPAGRHPWRAGLIGAAAGAAVALALLKRTRAS